MARIERPDLTKAEYCAIVRQANAWRRPAILEAAGSSLERAGQRPISLYLPDDFPTVNEEWLTWFATDPPARHGAKLPVRVPGLKVSSALIAEA